MAKMTANANQLTSPRWAGDFLSPERLLPYGAKVDATQFNAPDAVVVTTTALAAAAAVTIAVAALSGAIPSGTLLRFASGIYARLTAAAAAGAVALAVEPLPAAVPNASTATYAGAQKKTLPSGTPVGRTFAERDAKTPYGAAIDTDDEIFLTAFVVSDLDMNNDVELVRHGTVVKENYLPGFAALSAAMKAAIRSRYRCIIGNE